MITTLPSQASQASQASQTSQSSQASFTGRTNVLPSRFDVHQVDAFIAQIDQRSSEIFIDGSTVEMIDLAGVRALESIAHTHPAMQIVNASVALHATLVHTGFAGLAARCETALLQAA